MENKKDIGSYLRTKREEQDYSIDDVASKTKININILRHLESNEVEMLPNKTYVKGFVKSYCKLLAIDAKEALELLEKTYEPYEKPPEPEVPEEGEAQEQKPAAQQESATQPTTVTEEQLHEVQDKLFAIAQSIFKKNVIITLVVVAIVALILKGVITFFVQLSNEQEVLSQNKEEKVIGTKTHDPTIKKPNENLLNSKATKEQIEKINNETNEAKKDKNEEEVTKKVVKEEPKEEPKKEATPPANLNGKFPFKNFYPAPRNMYSIVDDAPEVNNLELLPERFKKAVDPEMANVYIHATEGDTWISYQSDEEDIRRFVLKKGRSVFIKGEVILLFMGNLNVANIFYNNQLIEAKSRTGVKSLIFPEEQAANYELPLFPAYKGIPYKAEVYKANMAEKPQQ